VHAISGRGKIRVSLHQAGPEVRIAVSDDGCGIAPEILSRIFDPFFTTREVGKGMGLGLTVSHDIASAHGGRIEVESSLGIGSTVIVSLPLANHAPKVAES
jgi:two-component system, NtrC family, sensor kinase